MGRRYFCEYCNRSFQDNLTARKQHLNGSVHMRNRQAWYQNFKDKRQLLEENLTKNPCNKFMATGNCPYGNQCKYRHLTNQELDKLKESIENTLPATEDLLKPWLQRFKTKHTADELNPESSKSREEELSDEEFVIPPELEGPLPPSLALPPPGGWPILCDELDDWG